MLSWGACKGFFSTVCVRVCMWIGLKSVSFDVVMVLICRFADISIDKQNLETAFLFLFFDVLDKRKKPEYQQISKTKLSWNLSECVRVRIEKTRLITIGYWSREERQKIKLKRQHWLYGNRDNNIVKIKRRSVYGWSNQHNFTNGISC